MIVCNKQDKLMAKGAEVIKTLLEKELLVISIYCYACVFTFILYFILGIH